MRVFSIGEVNRLRSDAGKLKKEKGIKYSRALEEIAVAQGWKCWADLLHAAQGAAGLPGKAETLPLEHARYYVHGDEDEDAAGRYFCELCDRFESADHFEAEHGAEAWRRTLKSLEAWRKLPMDTRRQFRRANSASNLFADVLWRPPSPTSAQARPVPAAALLPLSKVG